MPYIFTKKQIVLPQMQNQLEDTGIQHSKNTENGVSQNATKEISETLPPMLMEKLLSFLILTNGVLVVEMLQKTF